MSSQQTHRERSQPLTIELSAGDARRAAALARHVRSHDHAGIRAVLDDARAAGRAEHLTVAGAALLLYLLPVLATDDGAAALADLVCQFAKAEEHFAGGNPS